MANKWNYKHGVTIPLVGVPAVTVIDAPNDNAVGNVIYCDCNHPNASDSASNKGCANVPFATLNAAIAASTDRKPIILGRGVYNDTNGSRRFLLADSPLSVQIKGNTILTFPHYCYGCIIQDYSAMAGGNTPAYYNSIIDIPKGAGGGSREKNIYLKDGHAGDNYSVCVNINGWSTRGLNYNCTATITLGSQLYNSVYWLGLITLGSNSSDLNTICPLIGSIYADENAAIAKVETDLGLSANTLKNNGFRLLNPHFIDITKCNLNIDFTNYDCSTILGLRDTNGWLINRGIRCQFPNDFVGTAGFGETPNSNDGFSGALYCRNISSAGAITNSAYDTVLVTKKYTLPSAHILGYVRYFDKLLGNALILAANAIEATDVPSEFTFYLLGVVSGNLEDEWNSTNNTFSYSGGVLTTNLKKFNFGQLTQLNKAGNVILGKWDNGTFDLDNGRNIFKAGVIEFRIIAVKKGV